MNNNITLENYELQLEAIRKQSVHERDTKFVLSLFFTYCHWDDERIRKSGSSFNNPQLYQYEISLGKKIFEMTSDELLAFFKDRGKGIGKNISANSYKIIFYLGKAIWNYYIEYIDIDKEIRNPWIRDEMRIDAVIESFGNEHSKLSKEYLERIIDDGRMVYIKDDWHYKYGELLVRLFYDGISSPKELISIKESQIDFTNHLIHFPYKDVCLSHRTEELLKEIHQMVKFTSYKQVYFPAFYNGSYIPIIVKKSFVDSVNTRPIGSVALSISNTVNTFTGKRVSARDIYKLGFYDFIVKKMGVDVACSILTNSDTESTLILMKLVGEYGYTVRVIANVRQDLKAFL